MPTYQYACRSCGHRFEVVQSMAEEPLTICPECAGELRKVYAPPAIAFRGSGFYATDHGKRAAKAKEGADGAPTKDGTSSTKAGEASKDRGTGGAGSKADGGGSTSKGSDAGASSTGGGGKKGEKR